jgi:hypothetical protein
MWEPGPDKHVRRVFERARVGEHSRGVAVNTRGKHDS